MPSQRKSSSIRGVAPWRTRGRSRSSTRSTNFPPAQRAKSQASKAVRRLPGANLRLGWARSVLLLNLTSLRPGAWPSFNVGAASRRVDAEFGQQIDQRADRQPHHIKIAAIDLFGWLERSVLDAVGPRLIERVA